MAKTKFLTTIPQKVAFGGLVVVTVLAVAWGIWMSLTRNPTTISDDSIREEITPVVKLVTYEYNFTQLLSIDEAGNPLGWENPFTSKRYVATIDGKADIGIDADKMKVTIVRANMADKNSDILTRGVNYTEPTPSLDVYPVHALEPNSATALPIRLAKEDEQTTNGQNWSRPPVSNDRTSRR